ncbi:MAG: hypothetical protein HY553_03375 [Elusimicrobia bacterium]|nr:hypothetical protein [Elusimicrobiota bacterium]
MESTLPALLALQLAAGGGPPPPVPPIPLAAEPSGAAAPADPGRSSADLYYFTPEEADRGAKLFGFPRRGKGWTFDDDVPKDIQEQMRRDLAFMGSIEGGPATPLHRGIFGDVAGAAYKEFFDSRVSAIGVSGCGSGNAVACVIPILGPSKMWITKNYIEFSHPQIARLMVVFHEARHTEIMRRNWPHARCPRPFRDSMGRDMKSIWTGAPLAGEPACDTTPLGSYGSSTIMLRNIRKSCSNCTDKVKMDAELYADDQFGRIIDAESRRRMEEDLR